jgi:Arc/MetJ family transcription regulator
MGGGEEKHLTRGGGCHTWYGMKMTMHIDEALLERVMEAYECETKTEAVEMALREMDRRVRFRELGMRGLEMTPEEIGEAVDPDYNIPAMRVAEPSVRYGKK